MLTQYRAPLNKATTQEGIQVARVVLHKAIFQVELAKIAGLCLAEDGKEFHVIKLIFDGKKFTMQAFDDSMQLSIFLKGQEGEGLAEVAVDGYNLYTCLQECNALYVHLALEGEQLTLLSGDLFVSMPTKKIVGNYKKQINRYTVLALGETFNKAMRLTAGSTGVTGSPETHGLGSVCIDIQPNATLITGATNFYFRRFELSAFGSVENRAIARQRILIERKYAKLLPLFFKDEQRVGIKADANGMVHMGSTNTRLSYKPYHDSYVNIDSLVNSFNSTQVEFQVDAKAIQDVLRTLVSLADKDNNLILKCVFTAGQLFFYLPDNKGLTVGHRVTIGGLELVDTPFYVNAGFFFMAVEGHEKMISISLTEKQDGYINLRVVSTGNSAMTSVFTSLKV